MKQVYLDNAATTPVRLEVEVAMRPYFCEKYGNPSGAYQMSSENRGMIENVREQIAKTLNASAEEIYFTSGGTESDNWAIKAAAQMLKEKGRHIITSKIEHHAILNSCAYLEKQGFEVTYLDVDEWGSIRLDVLEKAIRKDTILISVMYANNEVGTIQKIAQIGKIAEKNDILFHTDAVQAYGQLLIDVKKENKDEKKEEILSTETLNDIIQTPKLEENDKAVINYSNKINDDINENKDKKDGQNETKKTSFNKILIISIIIGFLLGVLVIFIVIDNVFYKEKVTNCSSSASDYGYKYSDEYKITYKHDDIVYVEGEYIYNVLDNDYKDQIDVIKNEKMHVLLNSNGMKGFTYTYEVSDKSFKINSYLDFSQFDYKKINNIDQNLMPISYFEITNNMKYETLIKELQNQGYKCVPTR